MDELTALHEALKAHVVKPKEKKAAQDKAKADHAKADKSVNVKSLDARLKIIEAMLGLDE